MHIINAPDLNLPDVIAKSYELAGTLDVFVAHRQITEVLARQSCGDVLE